MNGNEMGNEREPPGSTIMHKSSIVLTLLLSKLGLLLNIRELTQQDGWKTPDGRMMKKCGPTLCRPECSSRPIV